MGTVGAGGGGGGGAETLALGGGGAGATGAMPAPGRGGKSSSRTYSVQREVKQLTLHYCYEVYERKNITVNVGHAFFHFLLLGTRAGWARFFHVLASDLDGFMNFLATATALILPLQL